LKARQRAAALLLAAAALRPGPASAQSADELAAACAAAGGDSGACAAAAVAVRAVVADVAQMAGPGSEIPGEGSTLGRRLGGMPRVAAWIRGGVRPLGVPDPADPAGPEEASAWTPGLQVGLGLGLFDGFRLLPTVGGFLSFDVVGQATFLLLSEGTGFRDRVDVLSFGARLGILRESFTLPGVTVSVARRLSGNVRLGDAAAGDQIDVLADPGVTSLRLTVSKDLFAVGLLAGVGWDDFSSDTRLVVPDGASGSVLVEGSLDGGRRLYFGSVSKQLGILAWLTVEGGWAEGLGPVSDYAGAGFDPEGSSLFASVTLLLKL
jgi:hypothetical protein